MSSSIPLIDISDLLVVGDSEGKLKVARQIDSACRRDGFFYITGHGISSSLIQQLESSARQFFAQPVEQKEEINMDKGGRRYRGYFPVGAELTGGKADVKEGVYFGTELDYDHPRMKSLLPLHGKNLFPKNMPALQEQVLSYMTQVTSLGQKLMGGIALGLKLEEDYFAQLVTDPMVLFMMFNYPGVSGTGGSWGVGEHTDYGVLTILKQDKIGGLQVKSNQTGQWIDAPPLEGTLICNIGDMLEKMTGGNYKSTLHRVRSPDKSVDRVSFPLFFGPNFNSVVKPIPGVGMEGINGKAETRWDNLNIHEVNGTYGDYLLSKVSKVFPKLESILYEGYASSAEDIMDRSIVKGG